jgi:hypothetical protein
VAAIFDGGGDSGDNDLDEFVYLKFGMPLNQLYFYVLYFYNSFKHLFPLQALIPIDMISKYFLLFHAFYNPINGGD